MDDPYAFLEEPDLSVGTFLSESLQVMDLLGEGAFGHVTKCFSTKTGEMEAVKIIKKFPGLPVEKNEVVILEQLRSLDPDTSNIIKWKESFTYQDHMCMSYELLDQDLQNYVKARGEGLLIPELKSVIRQVATALQHLRSFKIVHADIRPENIMIVDRRQQPIRVRLVDFGLSFQIGDRPFFQATGYRAPEVLLGIHPLTEAIDIWSTGATLVEVATASTIFENEEEYDELSQIIQSHGQPSDEILDRGKDTASYFCEQVDGEHHWRFKSPSEYEEETGLQAQTFTSIRLDDVPMIMAHGDPEDKNLFADLLKRMMQLDQDERITPLEVLQHPFLNESSPQGLLENNAVSLPGPDEDCRDTHTYGFLDCWRKPEYPERTHAGTGRTCKLHTESPQPQFQPGIEPRAFLL
ncbi:Homeodomain-interacting protein kinase 3 [Takifugu flavidus]|uniref:Homeodomain-interacting protein kinase 3 n=1 Tax=Takifugu flavidus TaxID=433684 RepID=A0A5C6N451_9TELE|nr:Homeodomain-interacting protein kinase 3 [Takifugu flavidus]